MPEYLVTWEINICAETPSEAADEALRIQRDIESSATVFDVYEMQRNRPQRFWKSTRIDLQHRTGQK